MTVKAPSPSQIRDLALSVGLDLETDEIAEYAEALSDINAVFEVLDSLPEPLPEPREIFSWIVVPTVNHRGCVQRVHSVVFQLA